MADQEEWMDEECILDDALVHMPPSSDQSLTSPTVIPTPTCEVTKSGRVIKKSSKILEMEIADQVEKGFSGKGSSHKKQKLKEIKKSSAAVAPLRLSLSPQGRKSSADQLSARAQSVGKVGRPKKQTATIQHVNVPSSSGGEQSQRLSVKSISRPMDVIAGTAGEAALTNQTKKKKTKVFSAYVLWCNEQRAQLLSQNPDLDFGTISRLLGDIWQTVPEKEKMIWRRKARKMTQKSSSMISTGKMTTGRVGRPSLASRSDVRPPAATAATAVVPTTAVSAVAGKEKIVADPSHVATFKVTGTDHIDVAAHLKLLGESLTVIGARLQEHKGQIAVQGSLSVLLDSLLCALGPIMCLTNQIPELNGCPESTHTSTLDNIAYIMPGVG